MSVFRAFVLALVGCLAAFSSASRAATVLITGANSGIGLEFAHQYAERHWTVIATHHHAQPPQTLTDLAARFPNVRIESLDVSSQQSVAALGDKLHGLPIDILINNAGVYSEPNGDPSTQSFGKFNFALMDTIFAVNVKGPLLVTQTLAPNVEASQRKLVVCISSTNGSMTHSPPGTYGVFYRASKAALNKEMQLVAQDLRPAGVTVLLLHPGVVKTEHFYENTRKYGPYNDPAALDPDTSVRKMIATLEHASLRQSGHFLLYDGSELPW